MLPLSILQLQDAWFQYGGGEWAQWKNIDHSICKEKKFLEHQLIGIWSWPVSLSEFVSPGNARPQLDLWLEAFLMNLRSKTKAKGFIIKGKKEKSQGKAEVKAEDKPGHLDEGKQRT